ncbi:MAG: dienelactone hydrolase family protein [Candidatus Dormibacteria bacterium]
MCSSDVGTWPNGPRRTGEVTELTSGDGTALPVFTCRPSGEGPWPTVLVIHDYFDPEHYYHELACRYAGEGYLAVCPSLFHRLPRLEAQTAEHAGARIVLVTDDEVFADVDALLAHLQAEGHSRGIALTGFCWGGRMAYLLAARHPEVQLLIPFYGPLVAWSGPDGPKPNSPLDEAAKIKARVEGFYGEDDPSIPLDQVREMQQRLREAGATANLRIVPGVGHSFFRQEEHRRESDQAWSEVLGVLRETMATPQSP